MHIPLYVNVIGYPIFLEPEGGKDRQTDRRTSQNYKQGSFLVKFFSESFYQLFVCFPSEKGFYIYTVITLEY